MLESKGVPSSVRKPAVGQSAEAFRARRKKRLLYLLCGSFVGLILLAGMGLFAKSWWAAHHVLAKHIGAESQALKSPQADDSDLSALTTEGGGRINILLLGVGDSGHAGAALSDTMLVVSIEPKTKEIAMLSMPRDLYVPIPGHGSDKINAAHSYGESQKQGSGPVLAKETVTSLLDVPIHNYIRVDFSAFKQGVTALGGVTVNVPTSLSDSEYPCDKDEKRACGFSIAAGTQVLKGDVALKYVRCRKGNCGNDFGRAMRQQQILIAMREKATALTTLTNPAKISALIDAVGDNAKTDLSLSDIQNLATLVKDIPSDSVHNSVLDNQVDGLVTTSNIGGASVVIPKAGVGNFTDIRALAHSLFSDRHITDESARVVLHNATGKPALKDTLVKLLESYHYKVILSDDVPVANSLLVDHAGDKARYTRAYLAKRFAVTAQSGTKGSVESDLELTVGQDYKGVR